MNQELKSEIQALAQRVLEMNGVAPLNELQMVAGDLYEKVTILKYLTENSNIKKEATAARIENIELIEEIPTVIESVVEEVIEDNLDDQEILSTLDENLFVSNEPMDESLIESATEKIKDIVAQMPPEAEQIEEFLQEVVAQPVMAKNDRDELVAQPEDLTINIEQKQKSLNDRLKKGITIGLNDRIAFVKHLFNGSTEDFNRVISQLNTLSSELEALEFLNNMVKPEYNNWSGKEEYEQRFLSFIEGRYA